MTTQADLDAELEAEEQLLLEHPSLEPYRVAVSSNDLLDIVVQHMLEHGVRIPLDRRPTWVIDQDTGEPALVFIRAAERT